jgi:signal transduction histidine kinase
LRHDARDGDLKVAFVANMSHEIRTPLSVILGCSELIDEHLVRIGERSQTSHDRVFEAICQEDSGYTRGFEGNGLGLTLSKSYLVMNGARISLESMKGKGPTFTVHFSPARELRDPAQRQRNAPILHAED